MIFNKEILGLIFEIMFCFIIIVFGYYIWEGIDQTNYNIAKHYDNTKEVQLIYESDADNGIEGNNVVVSIHNISDKYNNKSVMLKLKNDCNYSYIKINDTQYNLDNIYKYSDEMYNYYLIENVELKGYETKTYFIDMIDENLFLEYEFIVEV